MTLRSPAHARQAGRLMLAAIVCACLAVGDVILSATWSDPAFAKGGNNGGSNNGGGNNGGGNGGGNNGGSNNGGGNNGGGGNGNSGGNSNAGAGNNNAGGNGKGKGAAAASVSSETPTSVTPDVALDLRSAGQIKPLAELYATAERTFDGEVIDAKLIADKALGWVYDVRIVTEEGELHDVSYRATNLALISIDGEPVE